MFTLTLQVDDTLSVILAGAHLTVLMERAAREYPAATIVAVYGQSPEYKDDIPF